MRARGPTPGVRGRGGCSRWADCFLLLQVVSSPWLLLSVAADGCCRRLLLTGAAADRQPLVDYGAGVECISPHPRGSL